MVEKRISLQAEISVIAARGLDGEIAQYPPFENRHRHHILDVTTAPAADSAGGRAAGASRSRARILEELQYVGVLCVEFFLSTDGELLVNELAPRPHNSGHLTFDAAVTSQFEQQVRAICGLPLGSTGPAAAGGDGQPARRSVGGRRAELGGGVPLPRRQAAPVRQGRAAPRPQDGPPHGDGPHGASEAQDRVIAGRATRC